MLKNIIDKIKNIFSHNEWDENGTNRNTKTKYDLECYDINGWSMEGINKITRTKYDTQGYDINGQKQKYSDTNNNQSSEVTNPKNSDSEFSTKLKQLNNLQNYKDEYNILYYELNNLNKQKKILQEKFYEFNRKYYQNVGILEEKLLKLKKNLSTKSNENYNKFIAVYKNIKKTEDININKYKFDESIENIDILKQKLNNLKNTITDVEKDIEKLKQSTVFQLVTRIIDYEKFYAEKKQSIINEIINFLEKYDVIHLSNILDLPFNINEEFETIILVNKSQFLTIIIKDDIYKIRHPENNTWVNISLNQKDICLVKKQSYGKKIELNLIEINNKKIESQNKKSGSKQELEDLINSIDEKEKILEEKKISKEIQLQKSKLEKLKKELKTLELKFQELVEQKTEYLNDIEEFNREYNFHLGELIKEILNLKREILYKRTIKQQTQKVKYQEDIQTFQNTKETIDELKSTISELEDALDSIDEDDENYKELSEAYKELKEELEKLEDELELQEKELEKTKEFIEDETIEQEYEEVNSHYQEFESEYENIKEAFENSITLNDEEKKELKSLYKQAARLCHPDIVPDELKEKAHNLMQKLNDAYSKKDISKVKEILHSLKNGTSFEVSSETIEDKELLKIKIKEYLKNIEAIKTEIEEIKEDEIYQTIAELDNWDEYFEKLRSELEIEKERLEEIFKDKIKIINDESYNNIKQNRKNINKDELSTLVEKWIVDEFYKIHKIDLNKEKLAMQRIMDISNQVSKEIIENGFSEINIPFLSAKKDIPIHFNIDSITLNMIISKSHKSDNNGKKVFSKVIPEKSKYLKHIKSIENIKFEKIRKYCENLSKANEADAMQRHLGEKGRMYKALMYSSLEVFLEKLGGETITLCDWGCSQGIASMLVLDYIKEKQLDIKVSDVILIDDDTKALGRAMIQVEALAQDTINFIPLKSDDNNISDTIKSNKNNIVLNLFANDKIPTSFWTIDYDIFDESYFLCVSNENKELVDEIYENINTFIDVQDLSILNGKIGRFDKYERIFEINNNGIPFYKEVVDAKIPILVTNGR